jgi:hypothetical protein
MKIPGIDISKVSEIMQYDAIGKRVLYELIELRKERGDQADLADIAVSAAGRAAHLIWNLAADPEHQLTISNSLFTVGGTKGPAYQDLARAKDLPELQQMLLVAPRINGLSFEPIAELRSGFIHLLGRNFKTTDRAAIRTLKKGGISWYSALLMAEWEPAEIPAVRGEVGSLYQEAQQFTPAQIAVLLWYSELFKDRLTRLTPEQFNTLAPDIAQAFMILYENANGISYSSFEWMNSLGREQKAELGLQIHAQFTAYCERRSISPAQRKTYKQPWVEFFREYRKKPKETPQVDFQFAYEPGQANLAGKLKVNRVDAPHAGSGSQTHTFFFPAQIDKTGTPSIVRVENAGSETIAPDHDYLLFNELAETDMAPRAISYGSIEGSDKVERQYTRVELIDGENLYQLSKKNNGQLSKEQWESVFTLVRQLLDNGYSVRDLFPENIMIGSIVRNGVRQPARAYLCDVRYAYKTSQPASGMYQDFVNKGRANWQIDNASIMEKFLRNEHSERRSPKPSASKVKGLKTGKQLQNPAAEALTLTNSRRGRQRYCASLMHKIFPAIGSQKITSRNIPR